MKERERPRDKAGDRHFFFKRKTKEINGGCLKLANIIDLTWIWGGGGGGGRDGSREKKEEREKEESWQKPTPTSSYPKSKTHSLFMEKFSQLTLKGDQKNPMLTDPKWRKLKGQKHTKLSSDKLQAAQGSL